MPYSQLNEAAVERAVEKAMTSPRILDRISERISARLATTVERSIEKLVPKTYSSGQTGAMAGHPRASGLSGSASTSAGSLHYEYRVVTQDEIASVMAAMPGVTWRRCKQGHLYAVGECGNPVVTGYCIECKAAVTR